MIIADKITDLRKRNGWSQEELAEKLGVSRQSISKWESAQSVPDMNKILMLSDVFGVSTDYLLKDNMEMAPIENPIASDSEMQPGCRSVSMEEATDFLAFRDLYSRRVPIGVLMCILSPVLLILLSGLQAGGVLKMSETAAVAIGVIVLLLLVGGAVAIFIIISFQGSRFEYLEKEPIDTLYGVDGMVKDRREKYRSSYITQLTVGILLCVLSAIPIFLSILVFGDNEAASAASVAALLILVAVGVFLIVRCSSIWGAFQILLQEGDYSIQGKEDSKKNAPLAGIYWGIAVAVFLLLSCLTNAWDKTWIVWPVAGVTYGVVIGVITMRRRRG